GASLVTVTVSTGGGALVGGGAALVGPGAEVAGFAGSVAVLLSEALVSATAPTATTAITAAIPNINCGNRCHVERGSSIGSVDGTYCTCGRASVMPAS